MKPHRILLHPFLMSEGTFFLGRVDPQYLQIFYLWIAYSIKSTYNPKTSIPRDFIILRGHAYSSKTKQKIELPYAHIFCWGQLCLLVSTLLLWANILCVVCYCHIFRIFVSVGEFPFYWWFKGPRGILLKFSIVYLTTRRLMCLTEKLCVLDKFHSGTN